MKNFKIIFYVIFITIINSTMLFATKSIESDISKYADVSLDRLIGQMIIVGINGVNPKETWIRQVSKEASLGHISGVIFYSRNIENQTQLKNLTTRFKNIAVSNPLFIMLDEEGGEVSRINKIIKNPLKSPNEIANYTNLLEAKMIYEQHSKTLNDLGFNVNLAPVIDIGHNSLGTRTYSTNADIATLYAKEYANALKENHIIYTLKHFPGQGLLDVDIHTSNAILKDYDVLHLKPFYAFINTDNVEMIMVSHAIFPYFDPLYPASMSSQIINGILRQKLNYQGVVISDDVLMGGLDAYRLEDRVIKMINSGVDLLLFSGYFMRGTTTQKVVSNIIKEAVDSGIITRQRLEESYERITNLKKRLKNF